MNQHQFFIEDNPTDIVIGHIRDMLNSGELKPGERLPAERKLAEQFGVGRTHVRNALQKLEFYGIIKTFPQSGSIVSSLKIKALEGLISDVLKVDQYDFRSLVETRIILEIESVKLCAQNRSDEDLRTIEEASNDFIQNFKTPTRVEKDFSFHRTIARGSHNPVIKSMLLIITPDIMRFYNQHSLCEDMNERVIGEHIELVEYIKDRNEEGAEQIMRKHLTELDRFSREISVRNSVIK